MPDQGSTIPEEQLVLFKEHLQLQLAELEEQAKRSRAEEAMETERIAADIQIHSKNIEHAGKVLTVQASDRAQIRDFWSKQIMRLVWIVLALLVAVAFIAVYAIQKGETAAVVDAFKTIATHVLALIGGIGADRMWINRKSTGISPATDNSR